ncbi:MAG: GNAT family N-acetyltransferase [Chloroflexota bacterium]
MNIALHVEEASLNAWPALQTVIYDGWLVRFANNYTKRANSVTPLYSGALSLDDKIDRCEDFYERRKQPTIFRLPVCAADTPALDATLASRGYQRSDETIVQVKGLAAPRYAQHESVHNIQTATAWLPLFHAMEPARRDMSTHQQMLDNIISPVNYASLTIKNQPVACGLGVYENGYVGFFDIVVDAAHRRRGYGRLLMESLLGWGQSFDDAQYAYLQVVATNTGALRLYETLGFEELYRYWYRVK